MSAKLFAKIVIGSNGEQVVVHVDLNDDQDYVLTSVALVGGIVGRITLGFGEKASKKLAFAALAKFSAKDADYVLSQIASVTRTKIASASPN